jgi:hypothetical protein
VIILSRPCCAQCAALLVKNLVEELKLISGHQLEIQPIQHLNITDVNINQQFESSIQIKNHTLLSVHIVNMMNCTPTFVEILL